MDFIFISPGKTKNSEIAKLCEHYMEQIKHNAGCEWITVKEAMDSSAKETDNIFATVEKLKSKTPGVMSVFILDELGEEPTSRKFAKQLSDLKDKGSRVTVFLLGGAYGFDQEKKAEFCSAHGAQTLALSKLTFTHEMARLLLLEQVYRALHIQRGTKYHH